MDQTQNTEHFVKLLTEHQNRLYGCIYSLLGDRSRSADVVQETNLVLWRKFAEFDPQRPFLPWAFSIARFQVLAHLRDHKRDRMLLNEELVQTLAEETEKEAERLGSFQTALRQCLQQLPESHQSLIKQRYFKSQPVSDIAETLNRSAGTVKVSLLRIRRQLAECVEKRLVGGSNG